MAERDTWDGQRKALYKGRHYRLLYLGHTKYGERAKLEFMDGTKSFWCDAGAVEELSANNGRPDDHIRCRHCGGWTAGGDDWCTVCGAADYE
jgi:hypothetical protein